MKKKRTAGCFSEAQMCTGGGFECAFCCAFYTLGCRYGGATVVRSGSDHPAAGLWGHHQSAVQLTHHPGGQLPHTLHPHTHGSHSSNRKHSPSPLFSWPPNVSASALLSRILRQPPCGVIRQPPPWNRLQAAGPHWGLPLRSWLWSVLHQLQDSGFWGLPFCPRLGLSLSLGHHRNRQPSLGAKACTAPPAACGGQQQQSAP